MRKIFLIRYVPSTIMLVLSALVFSQEVPSNLTDEEKIFGLSKVWKEADKNFVFFDQVPSLDWDKAYQEYIPKILATTNTYDYYKTLQRFCNLLNDGHTRVIVPWQLRKIKERTPPIRTKFIDGKVYISEVLNDTLQNQGIKYGSEIVQINNVNVIEYAEKNIKPYTFYSTEQDMEVQVYEKQLLVGDVEVPIKLKFKSGKEFLVNRKMSKKKSSAPIYEFKVLKNNIGYLKINRFWGQNVREKFDSIYPQILKTSKLIIDVSENSGGSNGHAHHILAHLVEQPFETSRWKTTMYMPAFASWNFGSMWQDNIGGKVEPKPESIRYLKPLVVLISEKTYSAGEDFVSAFLSTGRGKLIGRPTAGTTGNPIGFELPGLGGVQICTKVDYLTNGREFVGYGIQPDILVKESYDDFKNNKHTILEQGVDYLLNLKTE